MKRTIIVLDNFSVEPLNIQNKTNQILFFYYFRTDLHEIMDAKDVLKGFIDNCNANYLHYTLSSNAVLEWFGRTFRGNKKIEQYLRQEIWPQYAQNFSVAVTCEAFEVKPSHMET